MNEQPPRLPELPGAASPLNGWFSFYVLAIPLAGIMVFMLGGAGATFSWLLCLGLLTLVGKGLKNMARQVPCLRLCLISFLFLTMAGLFATYLHRSTYGVDFGFAFDDSYYYYNTLKLALGEKVESPTLFEPVLAIYARLIIAVFGESQLLSLLPVNWALGSLCVALSGMIALAVTGRVCPLWLNLIALLCHVDFVDSLIHLYRDGLMLFLFLLALFLAIRRQYVVALIAALLAGGVRGANGMLALFGVAILFFSQQTYTARYPRFFTTIILVVPLTLILMSNFLPIARIARSFLPGASANQGLTGSSLGEFVSERGEMLRTKPDGPHDTTKAIHKLGVAGMLAKPFVQTFAPLSLGHPINEFEVKIRHRKPFAVVGIADTYHLFWLNILMWPFVAPLLLLGLYQAARQGLLSRSMVIIFFLMVMVVAFISFQPRHSLAFRVLVPTFVAFAWWLPRSHTEKYFLRFMRLAFTAAIVGLNAMVLLA